MVGIKKSRYSACPKEVLQAKNLIDLTQDHLTLSNDRANYDEFLARSRQLVVVLAWVLDNVTLELRIMFMTG